jgi:hypothetical protein
MFSYLRSLKQRKQVVVLFLVNTNNIVLLSAYFSVSAAASCGLVSFNGVALTFRVDSFPCGWGVGPSS